MSRPCCSALGQCWEHVGKGLRAVTLFNFKTHRERIATVLFSGEHAKRGVVVNFCPFCGKRIKIEPVRKARAA
ncbi:MAG: hypothetical protein IT578_04215 [Verrucomicrobiae bacterium]|nr:hypothetical protein [Verrucomicrobiae bacterium]